MPATKGNFESRFWAAVTKPASGCWEWDLGKNAAGYGQFVITRGKRAMLTHRIAWLFTHGAIPSGMCVLHRCDNPSCVRPDHLFLGTQGDNTRDCVAKGRANRVNGEQHPASKLTASDVLTIRRLYKRRINGYSKLAAQFGVGMATIQQIVNRHIWKQI